MADDTSSSSTAPAGSGDPNQGAEPEDSPDNYEEIEKWMVPRGTPSRPDTAAPVRPPPASLRTPAGPLVRVSLTMAPSKTPQQTPDVDVFLMHKQNVFEEDDLEEVYEEEDAVPEDLEDLLADDHISDEEAAAVKPVPLPPGNPRTPVIPQSPLGPLVPPGDIPRSPLSPPAPRGAIPPPSRDGHPQTGHAAPRAPTAVSKEDRGKAPPDAPPVTPGGVQALVMGPAPPGPVQLAPVVVRPPRVPGGPSTADAVSVRVDSASLAASSLVEKLGSGKDLSDKQQRGATPPVASGQASGRSEGKIAADTGKKLPGTRGGDGRAHPPSGPSVPREARAPKGELNTEPHGGADAGPPNGTEASPSATQKSKFVSLEDVLHEGSPAGGRGAVRRDWLNSTDDLSMLSRPITLDVTQEEDEGPDDTDFEEGHAAGSALEKTSGLDRIESWESSINPKEVWRGGAKGTVSRKTQFFDFVALEEVKDEEALSKGGMAIAWAWDAVTRHSELSNLWHMLEQHQAEEVPGHHMLSGLLTVMVCAGRSPFSYYPHSHTPL